MNILLFANIGSLPNKFYHVGDEAMFLETYRWYQQHHPSYKIYALTSQPNHQLLNTKEIINPLDLQLIGKKLLFSIITKTIIYKHLNHNFLNQKELTLVKLIKKQDRIHLCGGGNLTSIYSSWLYYSLIILAISIIFSKDIVLTSQTIGPLNFSDKILSYLILNRARIVAVRGHADTLKNLGIRSPRIFNMLDAAYGLPTVTNKILPIKNKFRIGLSLHEWGKSQAFYNTLVNCLISISSKHSIELVFIPHVIVDNQDEWDMGFMNLLFKNKGTKISIIKPNIQDILSSTTEPAYYIKTLTGTIDLLISTRYHGIIFALSQNIPTLTFTSDFYYSDKNSNALKLYYPNNYRYYSFSNSDKNLQDTIIKTLDKIIKNNRNETSYLKKINSKLLDKYDLFHNNLTNKILE